VLEATPLNRILIFDIFIKDIILYGDDEGCENLFRCGGMQQKIVNWRDRVDNVLRLALDLSVCFSCSGRAGRDWGTTNGSSRADVLVRCDAEFVLEMRTHGDKMIFGATGPASLFEFLQEKTHLLPVQLILPLPIKFLVVGRRLGIEMGGCWGLAFLLDSCIASGRRRGGRRMIQFLKRFQFTEEETDGLNTLVAHLDVVLEYFEPRRIQPLVGCMGEQSLRILQLLGKATVKEFQSKLVVSWTFVGSHLEVRELLEDGSHGAGMPRFVNPCEPLKHLNTSRAVEISLAPEKLGHGIVGEDGM
jgi:hypothetical protein